MRPRWEMSDNDKNVYILGAGFSHDAGIPLMNDFLDKARSLWKTKYPGFNTVFEYSRKLLSSGRIIAHNVDNIEELFGLLELNISLSPDDEVLTNVKNTLIELICKTINDYDITKDRAKWNSANIPIPNFDFQDIPYGYKENTFLYHTIKPPRSGYYAFDIYSLFSALSSRIGEGQNKTPDTIITFNYDIVMDRVFEKYPFKIDYVVNRNHLEADVKTLKLLKMHGSVNFKFHHNCNEVIVDSHDIESSGALQECPNCKENIRRVPAMIVPPTWNKGSYHDQVIDIWQEAYKELSQARRIIIIGYSLPETDIFFRHLLSLALSENDILDKIIVVDVSENIGKKYEDLIYDKFHRNFRFINTGLQGFLVDFDDKRPYLSKPYTRDFINNDL